MTDTAFNTDKLKNRDYIVVVDQSGSMGDQDSSTQGKTRWEYARETTVALARKLQEYDPDGITAIMFNGTHRTYENTRDDVVSKIFTDNYPSGGTVLAPVLREVFSGYLAAKKAGNAKPNGAIMMVITDGLPQDENEVAREIVNFTKQLSDGREEFGIEFVQVGNDAHARDYLHRLDDHLKAEGSKYDIVGCKTFEDLNNGSVSLTDALISSLTE